MSVSICLAGFQHATSGFFVDWDSRIREAANPGEGMSCVIVKDDHMEVIDSEGETIYECTRYESIAEIQAVAPEINPAVVSTTKPLAP